MFDHGLQALTRRLMILLIDNYDSFVHNLARSFREQGRETVVVRNDAMSVEEILCGGFEAVVISPGPCTPFQTGVCLPFLTSTPSRLPVLGVCLGHQTIATAFGGVVRPVEPVHGRASMISHQGTSLFAGLDERFLAGRYHSLAVAAPLPDPLQVEAMSDDGIIMGLSHKTLPLFGVQFHPESILTECGDKLIANFLEISSKFWANRREKVAQPIQSVAAEQFA